MKRVLIYSHDTFGLGNIRRMLEVARHLVDSSPEVSVLVVTGSPMLHAFRIPQRVDYLKLPCLARDTGGRYGAKFLDLSLDNTVKLRANLIRSAVSDFAPDLLLVDKKPFGVEDELCSAFESLPGAPRRPRLVLLLRDILDHPAATAPIWRKNGYFDAVSTWYDQVLVVGTPDVFDVRREYEFPPLAAAKVRYCGYIARPPGQRTRAAVRAELGVSASQPLVLVTPGGGEDGASMLRTTVQGLARLSDAQRPRTHIVFGPELAAAQRDPIAAECAGLAGVSFQTFSDDMMSLMAACDVAVSMGGYNTVCELLTLRKRAIVVPRSRPGFEQLIRAQRMAALGLLRCIDPAQLNPDALMGAVQDELRAVVNQEQRKPLGALRGLEQVSASLLEWLDLEPARPTRTRLADGAAGLPISGAARTVTSQEAAWHSNVPLACASAW